MDPEWTSRRNFLLCGVIGTMPFLMITDADCGEERHLISATEAGGARIRRQGHIRRSSPLTRRECLTERFAHMGTVQAGVVALLRTAGRDLKIDENRPHL
jgi:hypothetical protein